MRDKTWTTDLPPPTTPRPPPPKAQVATGEVLLPERYLKVGLTPDGREVIINHPVDPETVRVGAGHLVFSPAQARHLARLLLRKADEAEEGEHG
jgi:hypothetical protein